MFISAKYLSKYSDPYKNHLRFIYLITFFMEYYANEVYYIILLKSNANIFYYYGITIEIKNNF
jgi:hypothetical protein